MNLFIDTLNCNWDGATLLIFSENVFSSLIYYSHIIPLLISLCIGVFILFKKPRELLAQTFFAITIAFSIWTFSDLVLWADGSSSHIMFFWSLTILFEPIIYALCLYFVIVFFSKRDASVSSRNAIMLLLAPTLLFSATKLAIVGFDYTNCDREVIQGALAYYGLLTEIIFVIWIVVLIIRNLKKQQSDSFKQNLLFGSGILLFLLAFSWGNIIGSLSDDWALAQYGLFGMPVFIALLAYNIVKFKLFNLKLIGANVLVFFLWLLIGSLLAIQDISVSHAVTSITLIISVIFGFILIKSIRREVYQRERIELLAKDLQTANTRLLDLDRQKSEFVSFATHQLRAPLTAMKGYTSLILEGEMGETSSEVKQAVSRIFDSSSTLTHIVDDYLNISRIELGTMKYNFEIIDLKELTDNVIGELKPNIEKKGLKLSVNSNSGTRYIVHADKDKIKQVIANLIDNSVKYTPAGSVDISISRNTKDRKIIFSIKDTGVGISPEVMPKLFTKFVRAENANKQNIYGTGLGLYVAKEIVTAHKGRIWAESQGEGKGSTFFLELDMEV